MSDIFNQSPEEKDAPVCEEKEASAADNEPFAEFPPVEEPAPAPEDRLARFSTMAFMDDMEGVRAYYELSEADKIAVRRNMTPEQRLYAELAAFEFERQDHIAARRREVPMILAIVGLCLNFIFGAGLPVCAAALGIGAHDLKKDKTSKKALWSTVMGAVGTLVGVLFLVLSIVLIF